MFHDRRLKSISLRDLNTVSGSSELLREKLGFGLITGSRGGYLSGQTKNRSDEIVDIHFGNEQAEQSITSGVMPNIRIPIRIVGERELFKSDEEWKKYFIGGTFSETEYAGIYNENVYLNHNFKKAFGLPYLSNEVETINDTIGIDGNSQLDISTEYFSYYPQFQRHVSTFNSITSIPSYYSITSSALEKSADYANDFSENIYQAAASYFNFDYPQEDNDEIASLKNIFITDYTDDIQGRNSEIRETSQAQTGFIESDRFKLYSVMPYGNKISIKRRFLNQLPHGRGIITKYKNFIQNEGLEGFLLRLLKENFNGDLERQPIDASFVQTLRQNVEVSETEYLKNQVSVSTEEFRIIDLPTVLVDSLDRPFASNSDSSFLHTNDDPLFDTTGLYRHRFTANSFSLLNELNKNANTKINNIEDLKSIFGKEHYSEQLAFRIEKIGGRPTGDNRNVSVLQNFWFFNKRELMTFFDTQVKYNTTYTYRFYSYVMVEGLRYKTDTLRTTRLISTGSGDSNNCLEFYDPFTGITQQKLYHGPSLRDTFDTNETLRAQIRGWQLAKSLLLGRISEAQRQYSINRAAFIQALENASNPVPIDVLRFVKNFYPETIAFNLPTQQKLEASQALFSILMQPGFTTTGLSDVDPRNNIDDSDEDLLALFDLLSAIFGSTLADAFFGPLGVGGFNNSILEDIRQGIEDYNSIDELDILIQANIEQINEFENQLATDAQIFSEQRYMADFYIYAEPSFKIIEIPLGQKSVNIVDHPPVGVLVEPTYYKNGSKKLAFILRKNVFSYEFDEYPTTLTENDLANKANYMQGKDFISTDKMKERSVSPERFIEVYRLSEKPTSYQDFFGNLRQTIDLKDEISGDIYGTALFEERVRENVKYYYTFRMVSENGVSGQFSPIYESTLVDDGGYIYGDFVQIEESELIENRASKISIPVKKLLNIVPQQEHLQINFTDFDYNNTSLEELPNATLGENVDDSVWGSAGTGGRKYKFRLTSKKTQKKVDINIVFDYTTK